MILAKITTEPSIMVESAAYFLLAFVVMVAAWGSIMTNARGAFSGEDCPLLVYNFWIILSQRGPIPLV